MKKISVIIPSYNSAATIVHTLEGLKRQDEPALISEVIIVDSSDDGKTKELIRKNANGKSRIIDTDKSSGIPAHNRNVGAEQASSDILAFIDSDAYPDKDWARNIAQAYDSGYLTGGGSIHISGFQKRRLLAYAQYFLQFNEYIETGNPRPKSFVPACNLYCDRAIFEKVGGFPLLRASEDTVLGLKINRIAALWFIPSVRVHHIFREDLRSYLKNQLILGRYILIYRRLSGKRIYRGILPFFLLPGFAVVKLARICARIFSSRPGLIPVFLVSFPLFILGFIYWVIGFAAGALSNEGRPE